MNTRLSVVAALLLFPSGAVVRAQAVYPGRTWPTGEPRSAGINVPVLDSIDGEIASGRYGYVDRMLVIRHGRVVYDKSYKHDYDRIYGDSAKVSSPVNPHDLTGPYNYYKPWWHPYYRRGDLHTLQSVTKTVTSVVIGTAVLRGDFPSIDSRVLSFFDTTQVKNIDERKRRMTVRHLLTMTGGFDWNENLPYVDPNNAAIVMEASYDWIKFVIDRPMAREPGAQFNYSSGETQLLAHIFRQATGIDIEEYAAQHLFAPLGIERWFWKRTPAGIIDTEGGLYLEARDLARIWYLFMKNGAWNGKQVVSPDWVRQSVSPLVSVGDAPNAPKYGLKWWLYPNPLQPSRFVWSGSGFGGQIPMAVPELDLIIVFYGWNILPGQPALPRARVTERILRAVSER